MKNRIHIIFIIALPMCLLTFPRAVLAVPASPRGITLTAGSRSIAVSWSANTDDARGYSIYWGEQRENLATTIFINGAATTTHTITGLAPGTTYYLALSAVNNLNQESPRSSIQSITTSGLTDPTPLSQTNAGPSVPVNVYLTPREDGVTVGWTPNTDDATGYYIYWGENRSNLSTRTHVENRSANTFTLFSLKEKTLYYVAITSHDAENNESDRSVILSTQTLSDDDNDNPASLLPPDDIQLSPRETSIRISWSQNQDMASGYVIYWGTTKDNLNQSFRVNSAATTDHTLTELAPETTYFVAMTAFDNQSKQSDRSRIISAKTVAVFATPQQVMLTADNDTVTVSWTANQDDTAGYWLYWGTSRFALENKMVINDPEQTTYTLRDLAMGTPYYVALSAFNRQEDESVLSDIQSVTTTSVPALLKDLRLIPSETAIRVKWSATGYAIVGYHLYWRTSETALDTRIDITDPDQEDYLIAELEMNQQYNVKMAAIDNASEELTSTAVLSTRTLSEVTAPLSPENVRVKNWKDLEQAQLPLAWEKSVATDFDYYRIYYQGEETDETRIDFVAENAFRITDIQPSYRYFVYITAVDLSGNESPRSKALIVDIPFDSLAPNPPTHLTATITDPNEITVRFNGNNDGMADLKGYYLFHGRQENQYGLPIDLNNATEYALTDLPGNQTYFFRAIAYDRSGNESLPTDEIAIELLGAEMLLSDPDTFQGGCFVTTLLNRTSPVVWQGGLWFLGGLAAFFCCLRKIRFRGIAVSLLIICLSGIAAGEEGDANNNILALKAGYFFPRDETYKTLYRENHALPFILTYERALNRDFSLGLTAGFRKITGSVPAQPDIIKEMDTKLILFPLATTLSWHRDITPLVRFFGGIGFDYWYYRETTHHEKYNAHSDGKYGVSGFHLNTGCYLFTADSAIFKKYGVVIEAEYARIDRFGRNTIDLGGIAVNTGLFYRF